jgi:hypothetical protein
LPNARFHQPVSIFVGLGFPREVDSVLEAYKVLTEWPVYSRGPAHALALKACEAGLAGRALVRPVREAFEAFAEDRGILAPQALQASVARAAREWLPSPAN